MNKKLIFSIALIVTLLTSCSNETKEDISILGSSEVENVAEVKLSKYDVTFISNGGSEISGLKIEEGSFLENYPIPSNENKDLVFAGWYQDIELTNRFEQAFPVIENFTLYASWKEANLSSEYYFSSNGGETYNVGYEDDWWVDYGRSFDSTDVVIASAYDEAPVTSITRDGFSNFETITSVSLPNSISSIPEKAFSYCDSLESIIIPESLVEIEGSTSPFIGCKNLKSINVSDRNPSYKSIEGNLYSKDGKTLIQYAPGNKNTSFTIPYGVETITAGAFESSENLVNITIPDSVLNIGSRAFEGCSNLENVQLPSTLTKMGTAIFASCTSLKEVVIPEGLTRIENDSFLRCSSLESVIMPSTITEIGQSAFAECSSLKAIIIPDGVTQIESAAFGSTGLVSVIIPNSVTSIWSGAFWGCINLESITLSSSVQELYKDTFSKCTSLKEIIIPEGLVTIGSGAFSDCTALEEVAIPNTVTKVKANAFSGCEGLKKVHIGDNAFLESDNKYETWYFTGNENLETISVSEINEYYSSIDGVLYSKDGTKLIKYPIGKKETQFFIPDSVSTIGGAAFYEGKHLESIILGKSVAEIGDSAFSSSGGVLANIETNEENGTYTSVNGVLYSKDGTILYRYPSTRVDTKFIIEDTVTTIKETAFLQSSNLVEIVLPNNLHTIEKRAFVRCTGLENIFIPKNVKTIGFDIFYGCNDNLTVYAEATTAPPGWARGFWNRISYPSNNKPIVKANVIWGAENPY